MDFMLIFDRGFFSDNDFFNETSLRQKIKIVHVGSIQKKDGILLDSHKHLLQKDIHWISTQLFCERAINSNYLFNVC